MTKQHTNTLNRLTAMLVLPVVDAILCSIAAIGSRFLFEINLLFFGCLGCLWILAMVVGIMFFNLCYAYTAIDHDWKFTEMCQYFREAVFSAIRWFEQD